MATTASGGPTGQDYCGEYQCGFEQGSCPSYGIGGNCVCPEGQENSTCKFVPSSERRPGRNYQAFTGTRWQQDTPYGTGWQRRGVYTNFVDDTTDVAQVPPTILPNGTEPEKTKISVTNVAISMLSVGILFFVIGYSFEKGKTA